MRRSAVSNVIPRARRRITRTTPSLIVTGIRTSVRAHPAGSRRHVGRPVPATAGVFRAIGDRFNDDRDLMGLKFALVAAALLLVASLR